MVKKSSSSLNFGFFVWTINDYIRECPNIVRWNPRLAVEWMGHAASRVQSDAQAVRYNQSAIRMNHYLDVLEKMAYYSKKEVWDNDTPKRVASLEIYGADPV